MNRLLINTANEELFIVLQVQDKVFFKTNDTPVKHNEAMLPLIDTLLGENGLKVNDIDEFGVVIGPGSFTGIRVGIATIKAFRDSVNKVAKGVNNLDYLFALAKSQNPNIDTVAIKGSNDSYFVAKWIHEVLCKYERNLTQKELIDLAESKPIGVFKADDEIDCFVVSPDANILLACYERSIDDALVPVYYQLSQAENEKLKRGEVEILPAEMSDLQDILLLENESITSNTLSESDIVTALDNKNYATFKAVFNGEFVGFIILQITNEINIISVAVKKDFRNLGLATRLINQTKAFAHDRDIKTLSLEVSYKNITAYLLYKKLGFTEGRIRKGYYADGSDAVEMFLSV
ncbi:MAG: tRNA (adenosine(37)-N6)-threonylcarbamoyltransferase complex dimerization subunit type 1 TsaB [Clostridiales bacterium]|nr:tRNA (adenosine(37)-N6)-threonylcarbamoyltransferase complex dimerization subunit type 1 TsaB [Clostridiales bacterium]